MYPKPQVPLDLSQRQKVAQDTVARSESIIQEHAVEGATLNSSFLTLDRLPHLDHSVCPRFPPTEVKIVNGDSFSTARDIIHTTPDARGKLAVLNLASDSYRGGGWFITLSRTQEEALCYSSTLYTTLKPEYYPWPNVGPGSVAGIFSPGVVVFKHDLDHNCVDLQPSDRCVVSVITVAAPCRPSLSDDLSTFKDPSVLEDLRGKIKLVYRMAAHHGQHYLVLAAMGCGAYGCPPTLVAKEMKAALLEAEFHGWFREVVFAVYSKGREKNFDIIVPTMNPIFISTTMAWMYTGDAPIPTNRIPALKYEKENGFPYVNYPGPMDKIDTNGGQPTQAAFDAHRSALFVITQKDRAIPTFEQMKEELQADTHASLTRRISELKEQHLADLERMYTWHAEEYLDDALDRYRSRDDLMYITEGENNPDLKQSYAALEALYEERRNVAQQMKWEDDYERMRHSHLSILTDLYAKLKELAVLEEEAAKRREADFPVSIEEYRSKPKNIQIRVAQYLQLNDATRKDKMLTEFGWRSSNIKSLQDIYDKNDVFKAELVTQLLDAKERDPRKRF
ncbi:hypothetical protein H0H81_005627 [Sphagnurus paluster]|uniref:Microbial-type PARG catalytic domain-containing protein n=1 Tax=Sphagnurus paluster TaxID=117069 RepID=A0A9P7FVP2_9AGAR|nr:hypothetical protein H0H81_005627 [Sphagnurus paluster]